MPMQLIFTLSNSIFDTNKALSFGQEEFGKGSYKERYTQAVGGVRQCAQEVREELDVTARPMQSH